MSRVKREAASRLDDLMTRDEGARVQVVPALRAFGAERRSALEAEEKLGKLLAQVNRVVSLPLQELIIEENVRHEVDRAGPEFAELVHSIRETGILQNLIADLKVEPGGHYRLICVSGQRRLLAAREAGVERGFVLIKQFASEAERVVAGLAENMMRKGLHAFDVAEGYQKLLAAGWTPAQVCGYFNRDRKHVQRYLKLADYPAALKQRIREYPGLFPARVLLNQLAAKAFSPEGLHREVESRIANERSRITKTSDLTGRKTASGNRFAKEMGQKLSNELKLKVSCQGTKVGGRLTITYGNEREWARLYKLLASQAGTDKGKRATS